VNLDTFLAFLRTVISPKRLEHSQGVMLVMGELAEVYDLDRERALTAAILHDAGKELSAAQQAQLVAAAQIEPLRPYSDDYTHYFHGPVGAALVQRDLGITDGMILDGITMHTYYGSGPNYGTPLTWCLRFADLLEPGRDWSRVKWLREIGRLREAAYGGQLTEAARLQTGWLIEWFEADGVPVHPSMAQAYQELSA